MGNLVIGYFTFATQNGKSIPAWSWTKICPAGAIPSNFRPNVNRQMSIALQTVGAGGISFNADGSIDVNCFGTFGGPWAGNLQVIYFVD